MWAARLPVPQLLAALRQDSGPPGFYLLEKPFLCVRRSDRGRLDRPRPPLPRRARADRRGQGTSARRRRAASERSLLACYALLGLYAAEARAYALLALLSLLLFRLTLESRRTSREPRRGVRARSRRPLRPLPRDPRGRGAAPSRARAPALPDGGGPGRLCRLFAPWIPVLAAQPAGAVAWMREPPGAAAIGFLSAMGGVGRHPLALRPSAARDPAGARARRGRGPVRHAARRSPSAIGTRGTRSSSSPASSALALALSFATPFAFAGRTEMAVLPVWIWAVARSSDRSRAARVGGLVAPRRWDCSRSACWRSSPAPPSAAARASRALDAAGPARRHALRGSRPLPALPPRRRPGRLTPRLIAYPAEVARHPGWWVAGAPRRRRTSAAVAAATAGSAAVFLLLPPGFVTPELSATSRSGARCGSCSLRPEAVLLHWTSAAGRPHRARSSQPARAAPSPRPPRLVVATGHGRASDWSDPDSKSAAAVAQRA